MSLKEKMMMTVMYDFWGKRSFAQCGEDLIVDAELRRKRSGFYVDVGCYHPKLFSNSYLFYKKGWRGVCVDPNPSLEAMYRKVRPGDVFVNAGVGETEDLKDYYMFDDGAVNTFAVEQKNKNINEAGRKLVKKVRVVIMPLWKVLAKYLPSQETKIDLLSVDAESMDEEILRTNDWKKYRPKMVIAEDLDFDFLKPKESGVVKYLVKNGYRLVAKTPYSLIFREIG